MIPVRPRSGAAEGPELTVAQLRLARSGSSCRRRPRSAWTDWHWTDRHQRLATHPLLAACSRREVRTLVRYGEEVEVGAGMPLLREDSIGRWFVIVVDGNLALTRHGQPVGMLGPGAWVGDTAILGFGPQPASVTTASRCVLFVLGPRPVLSFAIDLPGLRDGLFPGCTQDEALTRAREMRLEGRARWDLLRPAEAPLSLPDAPAPGPPVALTARSGSLAVAARPFLPATATGPVIAEVAPRRPPRRAIPWLLGGVALVVLTALAAFVHVPYHSVEGRARVAADLVAVQGVDTHQPTGQLLLLSVDVHHDTTLGLVRGWLDPDIEIRTTQEVYGDRDPVELRRANLEAMERSKRLAVAVALDHVVGTSQSTVTIDSKGLGGPSAGLGLALAIVDLLTPGELTAGRRVAVTGSLDETGRVGSVGGMSHKARAAASAGADLLLVPSANHAEAVAAAGSVQVIPVDTFSDALVALVSAGGEGLIAKVR